MIKCCSLLITSVYNKQNIGFKYMVGGEISFLLNLLLHLCQSEGCIKVFLRISNNNYFDLKMFLLINYLR